MRSNHELVTEARRLAAELHSEMRWVPGSNASTSRWWADDISQRPAMEGRTVAGVDFIRSYAGHTSEWFRRAERVLEPETGKAIEHRARTIGEILLAWASQVESGHTEPVTAEPNRARQVVSNDIMSQVRALNLDKGVHPAAPVVLAGAALETALRSAVETTQLAVEGKGSISAYAKALRSAEVITKQDVKDIEQMGGLRNAAAHGEFDELSRERAGLMEQQVNLILARLTLILGD